jgi:hypothetical protein
MRDVRVAVRVAQEVGARLGQREVLFGKVSPSMTRRIVYVPFDHLNRDRGALAGADPVTDVIALVESERRTKLVYWLN